MVSLPSHDTALPWALVHTMLQPQSNDGTSYQCFISFPAFNKCSTPHYFSLAFIHVDI